MNDEKWFLNINVCVISLGCPKNLVDSEIMLGKIKAAGLEPVILPEEAQVIIVNTCGFIESAKAEAIQTILDMSEYNSKLIVTGCLAERYSEEIIKDLPEVDAVVGTGNYKDIVSAIEGVLGIGDNAFKTVKSAQDSEDFLSVEYLDSERLVSTSKSYAYLKVAEGCDNKCAYCVIPSIRGRFRSRSMESIINEARKLVNDGFKEIILVAQDTTGYGRDLYDKRMLAVLLKEICDISGDFRVRIMYCYPDGITDEFIEIMAGNEKICSYMDLPVQHGCDCILKAMNRRSLSEEIKEKITILRKRIPNIYIRTSIIVGFPGETEEDFDVLKEFVKEIRFDRLGVFMYSREEGTIADKMPNHVSEDTKEKRMSELMQIQQKISAENNEKRLGKEYNVVVEGLTEDKLFYIGRTYAEAPEIDGCVYFTAHEELFVGDKVKVKILNVEEYDLIGEQVDEFA